MITLIAIICVYLFIMVMEFLSIPVGHDENEHNDNKMYLVNKESK